MNTIVFGQNPWGVFNPCMTVISFRTEEGKPYANLVHYGVHLTAAGSRFAQSCPRLPPVGKPRTLCAGFN
ncbi:MAG: hypothetical protein IKM52_01530 [Clostridia bacterium]|nr:hypothetical protein [Clostridia bacterium]